MTMQPDRYGYNLEAADDMEGVKEALRAMYDRWGLPTVLELLSDSIEEVGRQCRARGDVYAAGGYDFQVEEVRRFARGFVEIKP